MEEELRELATKVKIKVQDVELDVKDRKAHSESARKLFREFMTVYFIKLNAYIEYIQKFCEYKMFL